MYIHNYYVVHVCIIWSTIYTTVVQGYYYVELHTYVKTVVCHVSVTHSLTHHKKEIVLRGGDVESQEAWPMLLVQVPIEFVQRQCLRAHRLLHEM